MVNRDGLVDWGMSRRVETNFFGRATLNEYYMRLLMYYYYVYNILFRKKPFTEIVSICPRKFRSFCFNDSWKNYFNFSSELMISNV